MREFHYTYSELMAEDPEFLRLVTIERLGRPRQVQGEEWSTD